MHGGRGRARRLRRAPVAAGLTLELGTAWTIDGAKTTICRTGRPRGSSPGGRSGSPATPDLSRQHACCWWGSGSWFDNLWLVGSLRCGLRHRQKLAIERRSANLARRLRRGSGRPLRGAGAALVVTLCAGPARRLRPGETRFDTRPGFAHLKPLASSTGARRRAGNSARSGSLSMKVVVVESPAKAKTINKYLGRDYEVLASFGHIRDLPAKDGSVDPEADFHMLWELEDRGAKRLNEIARAVKGADKLILATDPRPRGRGHLVARAGGAQREARAQGHPDRARDPSTPSPRIPSPPRCAPRARSTRRWSTPTWRAGRSTISSASRSLPCSGARLPGSRSAGRVQSVALRLVCDRERDIESFVAARVLVPRRDPRHQGRRRLRRAAGGRRRQEDHPPRHRQGGGGARLRARPRHRHLRGLEHRGEAGQAPTPSRPSPPRRCSRRPRASSAWPRRRPCASPSASTRAWRSAARPWASSPTCEPTASTWPRRRCAPRAP